MCGHFCKKVEGTAHVVVATLSSTSWCFLGHWKFWNGQRGRRLRSFQETNWSNCPRRGYSSFVYILVVLGKLENFEMVWLDLVYGHFRKRAEGTVRGVDRFLLKSTSRYSLGKWKFWNGLRGRRVRSFQETNWRSCPRRSCNSFVYILVFFGKVTPDLKWNSYTGIYNYGYKRTKILLRSLQS